MRVRAGRADGLEVQAEMRTALMARLHVTDPNRPGELHRVELVANWRFQPPVQMDIGPVLHPDDVMASKIDALCNRAAARDFLDINAVMLGLIGRLDDRDDFAAYGVTPEYLAGLRLRVADWRTYLTRE
ncbi:hypothetical protein [Frankia sp. CiP3]|uniref:hypothetical protein n=1 Tax=Frankia sp. CiP3 TaxID=2880971 RepID=UPI001EF668E6|nr:hypothetical protein [Frankia sp. CiP3]